MVIAISYRSVVVSMANQSTPSLYVTERLHLETVWEKVWVSSTKQLIFLSVLDVVMKSPVLYLTKDLRIRVLGGNVDLHSRNLMFLGMEAERQNHMSKGPYADGVD